MPNPRARTKTPVNLRIGITKPYLVTFALLESIADNADHAVMVEHREMVQFATNGIDAEDQIMQKYGLPTNERDRFIRRTVMCHGGPTTQEQFKPRPWTKRDPRRFAVK